MKVRLGFLLSIALLSCLACNTPARYTRMGDQYASKGDHDEATSYYYNALLKKSGYQPASLGLKVSAQKVLDEKFENFRKLVLENQLEKSVQQYRYAVSFVARANEVGVALNWPTEYDEIYADVVRDYGEQLFDEAISLINERKFDMAEKKLQALASIDTAYRGVSVLRMGSVLEPLYNKAAASEAQGNYTEAYRLFAKLVTIDDGFRDAEQRRDQVLIKATRIYALLPVAGAKEELPAFINQFIGEQLQSDQRQFVKVLDPAQTRAAMQKRGTFTDRDAEAALQAGREMGWYAVALVLVERTIDDYTPRVSESKVAYEAFTENVPNPYTDTYSYITKFKRITYTDINESRRVGFNAQVRLLRCTDGKVLKDENVSALRVEAIHQFEYKGNPANLFENLPDGNYLPPPNDEWRALFRSSGGKLSDKRDQEKIALIDLAAKITKTLGKELK